jgi:N-acetylmuramoyl-L-alanine amidase
LHKKSFFQENNVLLQTVIEYMTKKIVSFLIIALLSIVAYGATPKKFTLVIDAGHGGKDAGAPGKYSYEKNINLKVALAFGRYVERNCPDVRVIYTRKTDVFIPLKERAAIANRNKADVFISIHTNSVASKKPISGLETYTMGMRRSDEKMSAAMRENEVVLLEKDYQQHYEGFDPRSPESYIIFEMINDKNMLQSVELAKGIQKNVCRTANRPNKGVKQDAFLVLRETSMPACLIELGYITTASEEAYLNNPSNQEAMGLGIYQAFIEYKAAKTGQKAPLPTVIKPEPAPAIEEEPAPAKEEKSIPVIQQTVKTTQEAPVQDTVKTEPTLQVQPAESKLVPQTQPKQVPAQQPQQQGLVFKVQFMALTQKLKTGDSRLKGLKDVDCYQDGNTWKYTVGSTSNYNEIRQLRQEVAKQFPQAFIVAFKDGERIDTQAAIQELKKKK